MQAFGVNWLRWLFVMGLSGLVLAILFYLGFYLPSRPGAPEHDVKQLEDYPEGIQVGELPIPAIIWVIFIGTTIYVIAHIIYIWLSEVTF